MKAFVFSISVLFIFVRFAEASTFDSGSKVGSTLSNGNRYTCGLNSSPSHTYRCACSTNGTAWSISTDFTPSGSSFYSTSGIYLTPDPSNTGNALIFVVNTSTSGDRLTVETINSSCSITHQITLLDNTRTFGAKLGATLDSTNANGIVFWVTPSTSANDVGHLWSFSSSGTATDLTSTYGLATFDSSNGPIAASQSYLANPSATSPSEPIVAMRSDTTHIGVAYSINGSWHSLTSAVLPSSAHIGNSIAISPTPWSYLVGGSTKAFEWIVVVADNRHVYQTRLLKDSMNNVTLDSWDDLGGIPALFVYLDYSTDSLAASWYTNGSGVNKENVYVRTTGSGAYSIDVDANTGSSASWTGEGVSNFIGQQSLIKVDAMSTSHETYGYCNVSGVTEICRMARSAGVNTFTWTNIF